MGCYDTYCGLCGGPQNDPHEWDDADENEDASYGETPIGPPYTNEHFSWLSRIRVLASKDDVNMDPGFWGDTGDEDECFISGIGDGRFSGEGNSWVPVRFEECVVPFNDSDVEAESEDDEDTPQPRPEKYEIHDYFSGNIPLHDNCWKLLGLALGHTQETQYPKLSGGVRLDVIKDYLLANSDDYCTTFKWGGDVKDRQGQSWFPAGKESAWLIMDFWDSPAFREWARSYPVAGAVAQGKEGGWSGGLVLRTESPPSLAAVDRLPTELVTKILSYLPKTGVCNFRLASRAAATAWLTQDFWRSRVQLDFPYFLEYDALPEKADWRQLYLELAHAATKDNKPTNHENKDGGAMGGKSMNKLQADAWRNRKRVWRVLQGIAEQCWMREAKEREEMENGKWKGNLYSDDEDSSQSA